LLWANGIFSDYFISLGLAWQFVVRAGRTHAHNHEIAVKSTDKSERRRPAETEVPLDSAPLAVAISTMEALQTRSIGQQRQQPPCHHIHHNHRADINNDDILCLADLPPEVISAVMAWLPPPVIGACMTASRIFWVMSESALCQQAICRYVHTGNATGCLTDFAKRADRFRCESLCSPAKDEGRPPPLLAPTTGPMSDRLPRDLIEAAAVGRLDIVRAIYGRARTLYFGDEQRACCLGGPDATTCEPGIDYYMAQNCRHPTGGCAAFLCWIFNRDSYPRHRKDPFLVALGREHVEVALWIAGARGLHKAESRSSILVLAEIIAEQRAASVPAGSSDKRADRERLIARLWQVWPEAASRALRRAASSGDIAALSRMARLLCYPVQQDDPTWTYSIRPKAIIDAAASAQSAHLVLRALWCDFGFLFANRYSACRRMCKTSASVGCVDIAVEARQAMCEIQERATRTTARAGPVDPSNPYDGTGDRSSAVRSRPDQIDAECRAVIAKAKNDTDNSAARGTASCFVVARTIASGRAEAIDFALGLWRRCHTCATQGDFKCGEFKWQPWHLVKWPNACKGLVHVLEHHSREHAWSPKFLVDAIVGAGRADLLDRFPTPQGADIDRISGWLAAATKGGHNDMLQHLIRDHVDKRAHSLPGLDMIPLVNVALDSGRFDLVRLLWGHCKFGRMQHALDLIVDALLAANDSATITWLLETPQCQNTDAIWTCAARRGDTDLLGALIDRPQRPTPFSATSLAAIAVANGHVACAALLLGTLDKASLSADPDNRAVDRNGHCGDGDDGDADDGQKRSTDPRPSKRRRKNTFCSPRDRRPMLAPSYVVDALSRGHIHAIEWVVATGSFRIEWSYVSLETALDTAKDTRCFRALVTWATESPLARDLPRLARDLSTWAARALESNDHVRIGRLLGYCPWSQWGVSTERVASALCAACPVAMWRTLDLLRAVPFDPLYFPEAIAKSGRVDLFEWMVYERPPSACNQMLLSTDYVKAITIRRHYAAAHWVLARLPCPISKRP
jgi:hypothetical protein